jgi:hypothetical protein
MFAADFKQIISPGFYVSACERFLCSLIGQIGVLHAAQRHFFLDKKA